MPKLAFDAKKLSRIDDVRGMPTYTVGEAAHYLRIPPATLKSWVKGRDYNVAVGRRRFKRVIELPDPDQPLMSFFNLAEAHVLRALRSNHQIQLQHIR